MAKDTQPKSDVATAAEADEASAKRREIPGNLPYLIGHGSLKRVLDRAIEAQRPDKFSVDFLENVLKETGGSARATIPILKRLGFLSSDGTPTELYSRFKTESGRSAAALQALRNGFAEMFKRSEYAHAADDSKIKDLIVEVTGLPKNDRVASAIRSTFNVVKGYIAPGADLSARGEAGADEAAADDRPPPPPPLSDAGAIRLAYNINIVLPETSDLTVLNAIFRSIKENLLR